MLEGILTFFLVWVIFATAADERGTCKSIAGLAVGFTITLGILFAGPLTGAAMNPARAFGPQLVGGHWADAWIWYLGPLLGAAAAALLYEFLYLRSAAPCPGGTARDRARRAPARRDGSFLGPPSPEGHPREPPAPGRGPAA